MSRSVWRIASDTLRWQADDLSGAGAKKDGGRWNEEGMPVVYTSETRALACLETVVHLKANGLPFNRYLVEVMIPDEVWALARVESAASLPVGWEAEPAGLTSIRFGTEWLRSRGSALLVVPSVIVPEEFNILINPVLAEGVGIAATKRRRWLYDPRLAQAG